MTYQPQPLIVPTPFASIAPIIEDGTVSQTILKSLQSANLFGMEFEEQEEWKGNIGQTMTIPREAPPAERDEPSQNGADPTYKGTKYEETLATVSPYNDGIRVNMLENTATILGYFAGRMNGLGLQSANSLNAIRRKALYSAYLGGHAVALETAGPTTTLRVSSINGFQKQLNSDGKWLDVSSANPKPILIGASTYALVIAAAALDPVNFPNGRGTLTLSANASWTINDAVVAMDAPNRVYQGGGTTVDAISSTDILTLESLRLALANMEENEIPVHSDGTYWVHLGPRGKVQLWADPEFQNAIRGGVETRQFGNYTFYKTMGCTFVENRKVPTRANASDLQNSRISTTDAKLSKSIYSEITNRNNVNLGITMVTGGGLGKMWYLNQRKLAGPAGLDSNETYGMSVDTGGSLQIIAENAIRFLINPPKDDLRQWVTANWQFIGSFMCWNDFYGGTYSPNADPATTRNPYYKRAVPIFHYAG